MEVELPLTPLLPHHHYHHYPRIMRPYPPHSHSSAATAPRSLTDKPNTLIPDRLTSEPLFKAPQTADFRRLFLSFKPSTLVSDQVSRRNDSPQLSEHEFFSLCVTLSEFFTAVCAASQFVPDSSALKALTTQ